jgi:hypothetical protein
MPDHTELSDLIAYLTRSSRLTASESTHIVNEVLAFLAETPEDYIRRRHLRLQGQGLSNQQIFARLTEELQRWRFRAPALSERQIRRVIYG